MRKNFHFPLFILFIAACAPKKFTAFPERNKVEILNSNKLSSDKFSGIAIVSHYAGSTGYLSVAQKNHINYANMHGYDYIFRDGNISGNRFMDENASTPLYQLGLYWQKITAIQDALATNKYQWVLWIDADAVFTNMNTRIEDIIARWAETATDFIVAPDRNGPSEFDRINAGVFLLRNTNWSRNFLDSVASLYPYYRSFKTPEQTAMQDIIYGYVYFNSLREAMFLPQQKRSYDNAALIPEARIVSQKTLNAFYMIKAPDEGRWSEGDFVAHVAGGNNKTRDLGLLLDCLNTTASQSSCRPENLLKKYY